MAADTLDEDDLFGPSNEEYQNTTPMSRFRPPKLPPPPPSRIPGGRHGFHDGAGRGQPRLHHLQQNPAGDFRSDGLHAQAKFGPQANQYMSGQHPIFPPQWQGANMATDPNFAQPMHGTGQHEPRHMPAGALPLLAGPPLPALSSRNPDVVATFKLGAVGHKDESLHLVTPQFQKPTEVAQYSRTADGTVHFDDRCLRRFRPAVLGEKGADLNKGFETFVEKREDDASANPLQDLLHSIRRRKMVGVDIHFVTFRNNMNKILGTAYNRDEEWEMGVHKRGVTVYLDVHKLPERRQSEEMRRYMYYGYAYERFATESRRPPVSLPAGGPEPVDANEEFCAVLKTKLGAHRLIMGAEMDCYSRDAKGQRHYVELKTSREFVDERNVTNFERHKLLKFWIQSFLADVPQIVCGFRDDMGYLVRSESMSLKDITDRVKPKSYWVGGTCLAFADRVLCWLYGSLVEENEDCILRYVRAGSRLELLRTDHCPPAIDEHCRLLASRSGPGE